MEAVTTSETSVSFYENSCRNTIEDKRLQARCRENLKFPQVY